MSKKEILWVKNPETGLYQELTGKWEVSPGIGPTSSGYKSPFSEPVDVFVADKPLTASPYDEGVYHWAEIRNEIRKMQQ